MDAMNTHSYTIFALEPFPQVTPGFSLARLIVDAARQQPLKEGDVLIVASKVVSIEENRGIDLEDVTPSPEAMRVATQVGKDARLVQLILDESQSYRLATERGPIIAFHRLGYELTSAGVDRDQAGTAYLLPLDPDTSARRLKAEVKALTGTEVAVIIVDSDGRADRGGATVISIGASGISPLRVTAVHSGGKMKKQQETIVDMIAAASGVVIGQRGRGAPVAVARGITYERSDAGVHSILHRATK
jgi:coenzyme F420-0:L-glutamate ligase/coenzyme F420-1:gamma-L-glutamate ligase